MKGSTRPYWRPKLRFHFCSCWSIRSVGQHLDSGMNFKSNNPDLVVKIIVRPRGGSTGFLPPSSPIQGKLPLWFATSDRNPRLLAHVGSILFYDNHDKFLRTMDNLLLSVPVMSPTVCMWDPTFIDSIQLSQHPNKVVSLRPDKRDIFASGLSTSGIPS